ncbi:MAG: hypothetical protein JNN01_15720 [Opitutaceae bacterium]|nr:hypothetical protein [Opitutaceae bacterium]
MSTQPRLRVQYLALALPLALGACMNVADEQRLKNEKTRLAQEAKGYTDPQSREAEKKANEVDRIKDLQKR